MTRASRALLALPIAAGVALAPGLAHADFYRGGYGRGFYGGGYRGYGGGGGLALGAILGLGVGAAIVGANQPRYYAPPPVYYAPPPVYYAPPPRYYAPAYGYDYGYGSAYPPPYVLNR